MKKHKEPASAAGRIIVYGDPSSPRVFHVIKGNGEGAISVDGRIHPLDLAPALPLEHGDRVRSGLPPERQHPAEPPKLAAAREAVDAVRASRRTPSYRNVELMSEKLGAKVTRATIRKYHQAGKLEL